MLKVLIIYLLGRQLIKITKVVDDFTARTKTYSTTNYTIYDNSIQIDSAFYTHNSIVRYGNLAIMKYCFKIIKSTSLAMQQKLIKPNFCNINTAGLFPIFHVNKDANVQFSWCSVASDSYLQFASLATPEASHVNKYALVNTVVFVSNWQN